MSRQQQPFTLPLFINTQLDKHFNCPPRALINECFPFPIYSAVNLTLIRLLIFPNYSFILFRLLSLQNMSSFAPFSALFLLAMVLNFHSLVGQFWPIWPIFDHFSEWADQTRVRPFQRSSDHFLFI